MAHYATGEASKLALLNAAGELFAEKGLSGASVRDIVKKAQTTLSSVNYYFGSKEQLYLESIRYVLAEKFTIPELISRMIDRDPQTPQEMTNALCALIKEVFWLALSSDRPQWYGRLIARSMVDMAGGEREIFSETVSTVELENMLVRCCPEIDTAGARLALITLFGQANHLMMARTNVLDRMKKDRYDDELIEQIVVFLQKAFLFALNLPQPEVE